MRGLATSAAVLCLIAGPALSQEEIEVDRSVVEACFDDAGVGQVPDCIGDAAAACSSAQQPPDTTIAIGFCAKAETEAWDALLNREYGALRDRFSETEGLADSLRKAQRAWIAFRDADCDLAYEKDAGGSIRTISAGYCMLNHTARRALDLRDMQGN